MNSTKTKQSEYFLLTINQKISNGFMDTDIEKLCACR